MNDRRPARTPIAASTNEELKAFNAQMLGTIDRIRRDGRLTPSTRMIGAEIFRLVNFRSGDAWPSVEHLAEKLCLTDRTIKRATAALKVAGYIEIDKRGRCNRYRPVFEVAEKGTNCPPSETQKGTECPLLDGDRGQKEPEQGTKTSENRGQKRPPISLEISLGSLLAKSAGDAGLPDGAGAPAGNPNPDRAPDRLGGFAEAIKTKIGGRTFQSWFSQAVLVAETDDTVTLAAPNTFIADHLRNFMSGPVVDAFRAEKPNIRKLEVVVSSAATAKPAAVPELAQRRRELTGDAAWLVKSGIPLVAEHMRISEHNADRTITEWLRRCGRDMAGLRTILEEAAEHQLVGDDFANVVKQRTRALLQHPQLRFGPEAVLKRSAS